MKYSTFKTLYTIKFIVELAVLVVLGVMCIMCWINLKGTPISELTLTQILFMTFPLWVQTFIRRSGVRAVAFSNNNQFANNVPNDNQGDKNE